MNEKKKKRFWLNIAKTKPVRMYKLGHPNSDDLLFIFLLTKSIFMEIIIDRKGYSCKSVGCLELWSGKPADALKFFSVFILVVIRLPYLAREKKKSSV